MSYGKDEKINNAKIVNEKIEKIKNYMKCPEKWNELTDDQKSEFITQIDTLSFMVPAISKDRSYITIMEEMGVKWKYGDMLIVAGTHYFPIEQYLDFSEFDIINDFLSTAKEFLQTIDKNKKEEEAKNNSKFEISAYINPYLLEEIMKSLPYEDKINFGHCLFHSNQRPLIVEYINSYFRCEDAIKMITDKFNIDKFCCDHDININCPYEEKEVAKKLGARYGGNGRWYIPKGVPVLPFNYSYGYYRCRSNFLHEPVLKEIKLLRIRKIREEFNKCGFKWCNWKMTEEQELFVIRNRMIARYYQLREMEIKAGSERELKDRRTKKFTCYHYYTNELMVQETIWKLNDKIWTNHAVGYYMFEGEDRD